VVVDEQGQGQGQGTATPTGGPLRGRLLRLIPVPSSAAAAQAGTLGGLVWLVGEADAAGPTPPADLPGSHSRPGGPRHGGSDSSCLEHSDAVSVMSRACH
jgi:hypothetical protein